MYLKCLIDHTYQDLHAVAGNVYEVDDALGARLLRDFGPGDTSENAKRGNSPKFEATTEEATPPADAPVAEAAPEAEAKAEPEEAEADDKDESRGRSRR